MTSALLWVTHAKDLHWFEVSARSYKKFAKGWRWAKCIVPSQDYAAFRHPCEENGIFLSSFDEWPEKGFCHHMAMQMMGDLHFPEAEVIFHVDADTIFSRECTPIEWTPNGKILQPFIDFSELLTTPTEPDEMQSFMGFTGKRIDFSRGQYLWKYAADWMLGFPTERCCMTWMPMVHRREVYCKLRQIVDARFPNQGFEGYVRAARNEFPQTVCEFESLASVAYKFFNESYQWHNIKVLGHPFAGLVTQCWSHGGFDRPHDFCNEVGGHQTPRQLFERLGLL